MPMSWNGHTDAKLLVGILRTSNVKVDKEALAKFMGPECSVRAVDRRLQKLKAKVDSTGSNGSAASSSSPTNNHGNGDAPATPTPEKRKRGRPVGGGTPGSKKGAKKDHQDVEESPFKKAKAAGN